MAPRFGDIPADLARRGDCSGATRALDDMRPGLAQDYEAERVGELCSRSTAPADLSRSRNYYGSNSKGTRVARKSKKTKACRVGGRSCRSFLTYLNDTIIPDTLESGRESTAADLIGVAKFLEGKRRVSIHGVDYNVADFIDYLESTLIPDLEESNSAYADDFNEAVQHLLKLL